MSHTIIFNCRASEKPPNDEALYVLYHNQSMCPHMGEHLNHRGGINAVTNSLGIRSLSTAVSLMNLSLRSILPLALDLKALKANPLVHLLPVHPGALHYINICSFIYHFLYPISIALFLFAFSVSAAKHHLHFSQ